MAMCILNKLKGIILNMKKKKIKINLDGFDVIIEKKKFLSNKIKTSIRNVKLDMIETVSRDEFHNQLNDITIFLKDNKEFMLLNTEVPNLEELYNYLLENANNYNYAITLIDIETLNTQIIATTQSINNK